MQEHARRGHVEKRPLKKPRQKQKRRKLKRLKNGVNKIRLPKKQKKNMRKKLLWRLVRN